MNKEKYSEILEDINELMHTLANERDDIKEYDNYSTLKKAKLSNYIESLQKIYDNYENSENIFTQ